jgi:23S rRNA (uridine2552-2'-O)-methyltransferase
MKKQRTKQNWIQEHLSDPFVKKAQKDHYRSRAAYKLKEINEKYHLFSKDNVVVDLGSAPGSWSQYAAEVVGNNGHVFALDLLPMNGLANVTFLQGDFLEMSTLTNLENKLDNQQLDLVISDMAPNISGIKSRDQAMMINLNELTLEFAKDWLKPKGNFAVKTFIGAGYEAFVKDLKDMFTKVISFKPAASRDRSAELFLIGLEKR